MAGDPSNRFEFMEDLSFDDFLEDDPAAAVFSTGFPDINPQNQASQVGGPSDARTEGGPGREREVRERFAFRTRSEVEILDDGFKWRKYGKKMVRDSPYPRNYYKCSVEGCPVKKRVERDREDPSYVITTYEGNHCHGSTT